jgi:hypothetical protein
MDGIDDKNGSFSLKERGGEEWEGRGFPKF